jgi:autotransporter-associated beta strand protein
MDTRFPRHREVCLAVVVALGLSACGGGGGGNGSVRVSPSTPTPPVTPTPPTTPDPPLDAQLALTDTYAAHNQGFTGKGVTIGVVDSGVMRNHPALTGRVLADLIYVDPTANNTSIDDVVGHGTWVSEVAAGTSFSKYPGGIAPGANIVSARIIADQAPKDDGSGQGNRVTTADPLGAINDDLIANGAKVMNNSWGGLYWDATATSTTQSFHDAYNRFINSWGGLVVFAAGNDAKANPSDVAALPYRAPDLARGWLTVVAVDSNNPTKLASYSNACGVAMSYCLAAPGNLIVSGKDDTASSASYYVITGTSFAAPQVSGAAALVWQAYPYFNNDLVRQTLLGTATDLGTPGPDSVFGYGMLDVGKAVNGPAKFDWGDVTVNFSGTSSWNNPISGTGGLIKQGAGTLRLTQPSTYTGLTWVQGGVLSAKSLASGVAIGTQGTLSDTHTIGGNLANAGVLTVSGGDVNVAGSYQQSGAGRLALELGSALRVGGSATLTGGDLYVIGAGAGYQANSHTNVLVANGGLTGTFSALNTASNVFLTASLNYDATSAWLNVQQVQATAVQGMSYTAASTGAAQRVDSAFQQINTQLAQGASGQIAASGFIAGAAQLQQSPNVAVAQRSLESLSGQLHAASAAMTLQAIDAGTRALSDRFDQLAQAPAAGAWAQSLGYQGSMGRAGYGNVGLDLNGWMVGQDQRLGASGFAGFAVARMQGLGRLTESADAGRSRAVEGSFYAGVTRDAWYAMGRVGVGDYQENMRRRLQLGDANTAVASDTRGRYGVAYGESGYRLDVGAARVTPYMNVQYTRIQRDAFNELGGYGFGLKASGQTIERWQAGAGLRATRSWLVPSLGRLDLKARLAWQQSFATRGDVFDASFTGLNQWAPLGGIGLARYAGLAGLGLDWRFSSHGSLQLGYDHYFGQHDQSQMATLAYQYAW